MTLDGVEPRSTASSASRLLTNSAAPTRTTSNNATWTTTSRLRRLRPGTRRESPGPSSQGARPGSRPEACSAGASENRDAGQDRQHQRKAQRPAIEEPSRIRGRGWSAAEPLQQTHAPVSERQSRTAADRRRSVLSVSSCRTMRGGWRRRRGEPRFRGPGRGARQQQVRDVGTRDQQDEADHAHHQRQGLGDLHPPRVAAAPIHQHQRAFRAAGLLRQDLRLAVSGQDGSEASACARWTPGLSHPTRRSQPASGLARGRRWHPCNAPAIIAGR